MKTRNGFVSNSSSSSFIVTARSTAEDVSKLKATLEKIKADFSSVKNNAASQLGTVAVYDDPLCHLAKKLENGQYIIEFPFPGIEPGKSDLPPYIDFLTSRNADDRKILKEKYGIIVEAAKFEDKYDLR